MSKIVIKKPKAIVLELTGALATQNFMSYSETRKNHLKKNIGLYFSECYPRNKELRLDVNFFKLLETNEIREQTFNEACPKINDASGSKKLPMPEVAINHILWRLDHDLNSSALTLFILHYNEWAYKKNLFITPVYDEIKTVLEYWRSLGINVYVDVASANFVNMILESTTQGNLIPYFSGHMNLLRLDAQQRPVRDFHLLPTMLQLDASEILFFTRFPDDARSASEIGINTFLLVREDFHPNFKNLIRKAEEAKQKREKEGREAKEAKEAKESKAKKSDEQPPIPLVKSKSQTEVHRYTSGLFSLTSKLNELNKMTVGSSLSEDQTRKIMALYESFEDPAQFYTRLETPNTGKKPSSETDVRPSPSTISISDLVHTKYVLNLSEIAFK